MRWNDCNSTRPDPETESERCLHTCATPSDHLDRLQREKNALERELSRCHEQLGLVFEITEHISDLTEPDVIEDSLLRRYAAVLDADSVYVDRGGCCARVSVLDGGGGPRPSRVRDALAAQVELCGAVAGHWRC